MLVLVFDAEGSLIAHRATLGQRLLAKCTSGRLDRALARGASPESSVLLAIRAQQLVDAHMRFVLADSLRELADEATGSATHRGSRVPMDWPAVRAVAGDLRALASRLLERAPAPVRGVAQVNVLLTDGGGPLYSPHSPHSLKDLRVAVRDANRALDPLGQY